MPVTTPLEGVVGLVLAAGGSRRFGDDNKLLHPWQGRALLEHVLDALRNTAIERLLVVTGNDRRSVDALLERRAPRPPAVHNPRWRTGLASSLVRGISTVSDSPAVLVCLGDMPSLSPDVVNALLRAAADRPDKPLVVPVHEGRRGNPVLIRRSLFDAVQALGGDTGARALATRRPELVLEVAVTNVGVLHDIDTPKDVDTLTSITDATAMS